VAGASLGGPRLQPSRARRPVPANPGPWQRWGMPPCGVAERGLPSPLVGRRRGQWWLGAVCAVMVLAPAACSDGNDGGGGVQPDGRSLTSAFAEAAQTAYEEAGGDRDEDFSQGVVLRDDCFVVDRSGVASIVDALGLDSGSAEIGRGTYLQGDPNVEETLVCAIVTGEDPGTINLTVGTVPYDRDGLLAQIRERADQEDLSIEVIEGGASGLDGDEVLALSQEDGRFLAFAWVGDGFRVSLSFPAPLAEAEEGMRALRAAVDAVGASLSPT
jgi:hypothetical protein